MTQEEAREILARSPDWVRRARCDNVGHWIKEYLDTGGEGVVHPGEPPMAVAGTMLNDLNREAAAAGGDPYPVSVEQLAAYLVVNTAERAEKARQQRAANALVRQYAATYEKAYEEQDPVLSVAEVARHLKLSKKLIREHIKAGRLRAFRPGRAYKIRRSALEEFERETEVKAARDGETAVCPECRGSREGRYDESRGQWMTYRGGWHPCPKCGGTGLMPGTELCPACEERLVDDVLCQPCLESGRYLTCSCGAWAGYDDLRARHGDGLGGWVEDPEGRDRCPGCAGEPDA